MGKPSKGTRKDLRLKANKMARNGNTKRSKKK